tara:strand:- start:235 stop:462 length:228 start_codon:yes stop_codon:yes gene_type:complete
MLKSFWLTADHYLSILIKQRKGTPQMKIVYVVVFVAAAAIGGWFGYNQFVASTPVEAPMEEITPLEEAVEDTATE